MNIPENCDFPECDCDKPERCEKEKAIKAAYKARTVEEATKILRDAKISPQPFKAIYD